MAARDEDRLRVRPGAPKPERGRGTERFVSQVLKAASRTGGGGLGSGGRASMKGAAGRASARFGRGHVAAQMAGQKPGANARRVVIKSRYVLLKKVGAKSVSTHLRYIERDGVTREGERGQAYGADSDAVDLKEFEQRGKGDRHQFRFIVSVEDATDMQDLRGFTRELMQRMATDLQTPLDWVAVDHWDTDNPHTHVVLRGRMEQGQQGQDLVIAPDYMAHGMRSRACEIATDWLGPRTALEIQQGLQREAEQQRFTSLDRILLKLADDHHNIDLPNVQLHADKRTLLQRRLQCLQDLGLAQQHDANRWQLNPGMDVTLTRMGERGDIIRSMHKALRWEPRELQLDRHEMTSITGRVVGKGLADEMFDRAYLVVDGVNGRAHYLKLPVGADLADYPMGGIVQARAPGQAREVDQNIATHTHAGIYRTADHETDLQANGVREPLAEVQRHVRRLEALRRSSCVERIADGVWRIPVDYLERAQRHDVQQGDAGIALRSHMDLQQQVRALGATWLDQQLVSSERSALANTGFGSQVRAALDQRGEYLAAQGLAQRQGKRVVLARNLLSTLRERELDAAGRVMQAETGLVYRPTVDGVPVGGTYRRSVQLVSGRFAMLDDGMGFSLVPWRSAMEVHQGRALNCVVRGQAMMWTTGIQRGYSR